MKKEHSRIKILDSFRFLAIISVMAYHFYSTASDDKYYSFGQKWDNFFTLVF